MSATSSNPSHGKEARPGFYRRSFRAGSLFAGALLVASTLTTSFHQPAWGASDVQVSVFNQAGLNGSGCAGENENLIAIVNGVDGYAVDSSITDFIDGDGETPLATQLADSTFFFMTDMEAKDPLQSSFFPDSAATAIKDWTNDGGVMVMTGTHGDDDVDFLNKIYSWDLTNTAGSTASEITDNTAGTPFGDDSYVSDNRQLSPHSATESIGRGTVSNFTAMWTTNGAADGNAAVAVIQYGSGYVIYLGWDFYNSGPSCGKGSDPWVTEIVPAALAYATALSSAGLDTVSTTGGTLDYELSESGDYSYVVVAEGSTDPTAAQIIAGNNYGGVTVVDSGTGALAGSGSNWTAAIAMNGLTESTAYEIFVVTEPTDGDPTYSAIEDVAFKTLPGVPSVSSVVAGDSEVTVTIAASNSADDFEYSTDGGSTWTSQGSANSPWVISGLTNGTAYSFQFRSIYGSDGDPAGAGASTSASSVTPRGVPVNSAVPSISGTVSSGQTLTAADGTWSAEGAPITATAYQWVSTSGGVDTNIAGATAQTLCIPVSLVGSTIKVTVTKTNGAGSTSATSSATATVTDGGACPVPDSGSSGETSGETSLPVVEPSVLAPPRPAATPQAPPPVVRDGPVLRNGVAPRALPVPQVRVGGLATVIETEVPDSSRLAVRFGRTALDVQVDQGDGSVAKSEDGKTEIAVRKGGNTTVSGSGWRPQSTVQVFLPLQGSNAKELTRISVGDDGAFSGDALFATAPDEQPMPVGPQVLQLVSVDEAGNEVVLEMTVNIAQPAPAPEFNRLEGVVPTQAPGTSIATNAGVPEQVTVSAVEDQKLAVVEGEGWSMAIGVLSEDGAVQSAEGGASITLVRDESAQVSGDGFMPGTRADVWLFSDPTLLGTVTIDDEGRFDGEVNIDGRVIAVGEHTLQLQGVGADGYVRAANMGVTVGDANVAAEATAATSLTFLWWILLAVLVTLLIIAAVVRRRRRA